MVRAMFRGDDRAAGTSIVPVAGPKTRTNFDRAYRHGNRLSDSQWRAAPPRWHTVRIYEEALP